MIPISSNHFQQLEQWLIYAQENEHPLVVDFVKESALIVFDTEMVTAGRPSQKNWHYCSLVLSAAEDNIGNAMSLIEPAIGKEAAKMFENFAKKGSK